MKIAVPYENGEVFQHFGKTQEFKVYETSDGEILSSEILKTNGSGHGALGDFLKQAGVQFLLCGGIGNGAKMKLMEVGISLLSGVAGPADQQVQDLLKGELKLSGSSGCAGHDGCGGHGAGHDGCGSGCH